MNMLKLILAFKLHTLTKYKNIHGQYDCYIFLIRGLCPTLQKCVLLNFIKCTIVLFGPKITETCSLSSEMFKFDKFTHFYVRFL